MSGFYRRGKMFETVEAYFLYCSTGCTCCAEDNHYRGPYRTAEEAGRRKAYFYAHPILASQYTSTGHYSISGPSKAEILPDGRLIIDSTVYEQFFTVKEDGTCEVEDKFYD